MTVPSIPTLSTITHYLLCRYLHHFYRNTLVLGDVDIRPFLWFLGWGYGDGDVYAGFNCRDFGCIWTCSPSFTITPNLSAPFGHSLCSC